MRLEVAMPAGNLRIAPERKAAEAALGQAWVWTLWLAILIALVLAGIWRGELSEIWRNATAL